MKELVLHTTTIIICVTATGCAMSKAITGPDGSQHELVSCNWGIERCFAESRKKCGGDYEIIYSNSAFTFNWLLLGTTGEMLIKCKSSRSISKTQEFDGNRFNRKVRKDDNDYWKTKDEEAKKRMQEVEERNQRNDE